MVNYGYSASPFFYGVILGKRITSFAARFRFESYTERFALGFTSATPGNFHLEVRCLVAEVIMIKFV